MQDAFLLDKLSVLIMHVSEFLDGGCMSSLITSIPLFFVHCLSFQECVNLNFRHIHQGQFLLVLFIFGS